MKTSIKPPELVDYLSGQLRVFFPDRSAVDRRTLTAAAGRAMERTEFCFSRVRNKYFWDGRRSLFNHLNADQYAMFLYFAANTLYRKNGDPKLCSKLFLLNRCLHGVDAFYEVALPDIFLFVHPMGTIIGRAHYSDYFLVYQQCTIGSNQGVYPKLGKHVSVHPGAAVLGDCQIGDNCKISAGSVLMDKDLKANSVYIGNTLKASVKISPKRLPIWVGEKES